MDHFDLNIKNYSIDELKDMFDLPTNYDENIVEIQSTKLRDNILKNNKIDGGLREKTINFLVEAKNILLINNQPEPNNNKFQQTLTELYNSAYDLKTTKIEDPQEHMVQVRNKKPYLSSFPSEFFPGVINPLKRRVNRKNLNIDTRFRENYYTSLSTNFQITLPLIMNDVLTMQLQALELPTSFYTISKLYKNNYFTISGNIEGDPAVTHIITIPNGNYNYDGIESVINDALIALGGVFQYIKFKVDLNTAININGTDHMVVSIDPTYVGPPFEFSLNFLADQNGYDDPNTDLQLKFGWLLGFRKGIYEGLTTYTSEGIVDLTGPRYLYLVIDDYNNNVNNNFYGAFKSSLLNNNILARISVSSKLFTIYSENNFNIVTNPRTYFGPVDIRNINVQLLDEYGRIVDLNSMDYSFCLTFQTSYDI
jgi:hypothetical protein